MNASILLPVRKTCTKSNEEHNSCGSSCAKTCQNKDKQMMCAAVCKDGCYCTICTKSNEEHNSCGSCEKTCQNKDKGLMCAAVCTDGCYCKEGYIRDEESGQCISPSKCPKVVILNKNLVNIEGTICTKSNEEYNDCGTCEKTCQNRHKWRRMGCIAACFHQCYCQTCTKNNEAYDECR
ncbi:unnamed protein product, partial [Medioppia subpectinata]